MKLMLCKSCYDVVRLKITPRKCSCGKCEGYYLNDGLNAIMTGPFVPIGIDNNSLVSSIENQPDSGMGKKINAFIIPKCVPTINDGKNLQEDIEQPTDESLRRAVDSLVNNYHLPSKT